MKIVLAEDRSGKLTAERAFTSEVVRVGRDPATCQYAFEQGQWPMVSRKHAEFRLGDGRCLVADTNSRFGTFLNGQKISEPVEVKAGAHVQLGGGGPILRVVSIEQTQPSKAEPHPSDLARMAPVRESQEKKAPAAQVVSTPAVTPSPIADNIVTQKI